MKKLFLIFALVLASLTVSAQIPEATRPDTMENADTRKYLRDLLNWNVLVNLTQRDSIYDLALLIEDNAGDISTINSGVIDDIPSGDAAYVVMYNPVTNQAYRKDSTGMWSGTGGGTTYSAGNGISIDANEISLNDTITGNFVLEIPGSFQIQSNGGVSSIYLDSDNLTLDGGTTAFIDLDNSIDAISMYSGLGYFTMDGTGVYTTQIPTDNAETYLMAIDETNGLWSKRSVASLPTGSSPDSAYITVTADTAFISGSNYKLYAAGDSIMLYDPAVGVAVSLYDLKNVKWSELTFEAGDTTDTRSFVVKGDLFSFPFGLGANNAGDSAVIQLNANMGVLPCSLDTVVPSALKIKCSGNSGGASVQLFYGSDPYAAGTSLCSSTAVTEAGGWVTVSSFTAATVPKGQYIWAEVSAASGTKPNQLIAIFEYEFQ